MPLNPGQSLVSRDRTRFKVIVAGRRWGKTFLAIRELARVASQPDCRVFYVAPTYRQAKQIVWDQLKWRLQDLRWTTRVNESDLTIVLKNGSKISLRGADNPDSLRGVGLDAIVMDEFAMIDEKAWTEVLRPTLSDRQGSAMFISTPMGQANWAYDLYNRGLDPTESEWSSYQFTTLDGGNVSEQEIAQARQDLDERTFRQEYLASFETYSNRLFYAFDRAHNIETWNGPTPDILHIGLDFNVGMMSGAVFAQLGDSVHAIDEIALLSSNTTEVVAEIRERYPRQKIFVYPDPAGSARKTSAGGVTDHSILANAGFVVKAPRAHTPVRDGVNAVNSMLCSASGARRLRVDPRCRKIIESFEKHSYKINSNIPDKDSGFDHMSDAVRYYIDYVWPVRRDMPAELPQRWGHAIGTHNSPGHQQQRTIRI
jgi:phage terminase large subunit